MLTESRRRACLGTENSLGQTPRGWGKMAQRSHSSLMPWFLLEVESQVQREGEELATRPKSTWDLRGQPGEPFSCHKLTLPSRGKARAFERRAGRKAFHHQVTKPATQPPRKHVIYAIRQSSVRPPSPKVNLDHP